jgi:hypothetical protein
MGLKSKLFRGDSKLEAAAISDPAHILHGATGPHVGKIQRALIVLDGATIDDELRKTVYGNATCTAVLAYKRKRSIINRSYQNTADNIVGKMTMARLDDEMVRWEMSPHARVRIIPLSYARSRPARPAHLAALMQQSQHLELNFALGANVAALPLPPMALHFNPQKVLVIDRNGGTGRFEVLGGNGGDIKVFDRDLVLIQPIFDDFMKWVPTKFSDSFVIQDDPQPYTVKSVSDKLGEAQLGVTTPAGDRETFIVVVTKVFPSAPRFQAPKPHDHPPSGKWPVIQADPQSDTLVNFFCSGFADPKTVMDNVKKAPPPIGLPPLGIEHLDWYLTQNGADFNEDLNILRWLNQDSHIRARLKKEIFPPGKKRVAEGHFTFSRNDFDSSKTRDFATSFGQIDRVDFSVDFSDDTVRVWFQDRYEFHPVYPGLYLPKQSDDFVRGDNCVHAAAVEMKSQGARDYWMKGQAVVPLSLITR